MQKLWGWDPSFQKLSVPTPSTMIPRDEPGTCLDELSAGSCTCSQVPGAVWAPERGHQLASHPGRDLKGPGAHAVVPPLEGCVPRDQAAQTSCRMAQLPFPCFWVRRGAEL